MATVKRFLYEVLLRGAPDGTITAAHAIHCDAIIGDDGQVTGTATPQNAEPVELDKVKDIIGEGFTGTVQQLAGLSAQCEQLMAQRDAAIAERDQWKAAHDGLAQKLAAAATALG